MSFIFHRLLVTASAAALSCTPAFGQFAEIAFIVDESGSMSGEQSFLQTFVPDLSARLSDLGTTTRFGLVGYGDSAVVPRQVDVGGGQFGTAEEFAAAAATLQVSGGTEDGYAGINFALKNYAFSTDPGVTRLIVLVTDEDRDNTDPSLTSQLIAQELVSRDIFFAGILDQGVETPEGIAAIGASATQTFLDQDNDGEFEVAGAPVLTFASGTTQADYTDVILGNPNGCFADLNALRAGDAPAQAFASILASCIVRIVTDTSRIDPYVIYAARDTILNASQSFANQMNLRLTGRLGGRDRDHGNALVLSEGDSGTTASGDRMFLTASGTLPQGTQEFDIGSLKGYVSLQGEYSETDYDEPYQDYDRRSFTGSFGMDYEYAPGTLIGASLGYHSSEAESQSGTDTVDTEAYSVGVYAGTRFGLSGYLDGTLQYTWGDIETKRATGGGFASGSTDVEAFTVTTTIGKVFQAHGFDINPSLGLGYSHIKMDAFTETGPGAVTFDPESLEVFWATPRIDVYKPMQRTWGTIMPTAGIGVRFQGGDDGSVLTTTAGGVTSPLSLPELDDVSLIASAGVAFTNTQNTMALRLDYTGTFGERTDSHAANLGFRMAF